MAMLTRTVALKWDIPPACHEYSVPGIGMCPPFGQKSMCPSYKNVIVILKHNRLYISKHSLCGNNLKIARYLNVTSNRRFSRFTCGSMHYIYVSRVAWVKSASFIFSIKWPTYKQFDIIDTLFSAHHQILFNEIR